MSMRLIACVSEYKLHILTISLDSLDTYLCLLWYFGSIHAHPVLTSQEIQTTIGLMPDRKWPHVGVSASVKNGIHPLAKSIYDFIIPLLLVVILREFHIKGLIIRT